MLCIYFAICRNLENKIKNKIIAKEYNFLEGKSEKLKLLLGDENKNENKTRLDSFFEELCHYDIFALRRLNNLIGEDNFENVVLFIIYSIKSYSAGEQGRKKEYKEYFSRVAKIIKKLDQGSLKKFFDIIKEELDNIDEKTKVERKNRIFNFSRIVMNLDSYRDYDVVKFAIFICQLKKVEEAFSNFKGIIGINTSGPIGNFNINFVKIINVLDQNGLNNFVEFINRLGHNELETFAKFIDSSIYLERKNFSLDEVDMLDHKSIENFGKLINVLEKSEVCELIINYIKTIGLDKFFCILNEIEGNVKEEFIKKLDNKLNLINTAGNIINN